MAAAADCHLLFGLIALQVGLIDQAQLVTAFQAWARDKSRPLADHLAARGDLDIADRVAVEALAARHLTKHGGDPEKSLAAISLGRSTRESLGRLGDAAIEASIGHAGSTSTQPGEDFDRTSSYAVGTVTSDGQRFRLLRPHAQGGLGAVIVALDTELHREVALKQLLGHHADDPDSRQRFLIEAEITGGLEHPGIVPVYGLGSYDDGRPYYAMRFIKGDSLKEAIEQFHSDASKKTDIGLRSLELRKLLRRFLDVCNAVHYAHSRGVLHRDIKPGNIIVGKHGETLVVDWGLAKPLGRIEPGSNIGERTLMPSSASGSSETLPGSALGTPAYMSPEQAGGDLDRLGPRSDVYSLGATLYCLLVGRRPLAGDDVGEILRRVQRGEFPRPRQLEPSIDPALQAICLKAMATKPEDRYATARALADQVERWMADEPVDAYRELFSRQARRWAKRNRTAVTGAAVALLAGVVGLAAVLAVQTRAKGAIARALANETRANAALSEANQRVEERYALATEAIKTFHTGVSEDFLLKEEKFKDLRQRLLTSAAGFYGRLGALLGRETDLTSRRALNRATFELAELTAKIGRNEDALSTHRQALSRRRELALEPGAEAETRADVGRSLTSVASLLEATGKTDEALAAYQEAERLLAALAPRAPETLSALADCRSRLGWFLSTIGRSDEALAVYRLARIDQESLAELPGAANEARSDLTATINRIGALLWRTGKPAEAEAEFRKALAIRQKLAYDNPAKTGFRTALAQSHFNLGILLSKTGKLRAAEAGHRNALAIRQKLAYDNPAVTLFRSDVAMSHVCLGILLSQTGNPSEAEAEHRKALVIEQRLADDNPAVTQFRSALAYSHEALGYLLSPTGKAAEAEAEYRKALAIRQKLADDNPAVTEFRNALADCHSNLGCILPQTGKPAEAESEHQKALAIRQRLAEAEPGNPAWRNEIGVSLTSLGDVDTEAGRLDTAIARYRESLVIHERLAHDHPTITAYRRELAAALTGLGRAEHRAGRRAAAVEPLKRAATLWEAIAEPDFEARYELARDYTLLAAAAADSRSGLSAAYTAATADRAIAALRQAVAAGFHDLAKLRTDADLAALRDRDDFRLLLLDLAMPVEPFAPGR